MQTTFANVSIGQFFVLGHEVYVRVGETLCQRKSGHGFKVITDGSVSVFADDGTW